MPQPTKAAMPQWRMRETGVCLAFRGEVGRWNFHPATEPVVGPLSQTVRLGNASYRSAWEVRDTQGNGHSGLPPRSPRNTEEAGESGTRRRMAATPHWSQGFEFFEPGPGETQDSSRSLQQTPPTFPSSLPAIRVEPAVRRNRPPEHRHEAGPAEALRWRVAFAIRSVRNQKRKGKKTCLFGVPSKRAKSVKMYPKIVPHKAGRVP